MKISALAPWFGSKRTLAPRIVAELGPHSCYWEPFCESCAVLLAKNRVRMETINDLHGDLVNLARVVQDDELSADLFARLYRTSFCEALFDDARGQLSEPCAEEKSVDRAAAFFTASWMGRNGMCGLRETGVGFCLRYTANGGDPGKRFASAVESIPEWYERLRQVWIVSRDAFELLERIDDADGHVIYADPPYLVKSEDYLHDFADADHAKLAASLGRFKRTRIVVSYYDHPRLAEIYPGWSKVDCSMSKALHLHSKRKSEKAIAPEVLLINGPSLTGADGGLF